MSFQPTIPIGGLAGWSLLQRTLPRQQAAFAEAPVQRTMVARFVARFDAIDTSTRLVNDPSVLGVVLGAFGLQDDLPNRGFIARLIDQGTDAPGALATRLSDKRYAALVKALAHLGPGGDGRPPPDLRDRIVAQYQARSFEVAVGAQNQDFRLAMAALRELPDLTAQFSTDEARWFGILGNPPLRRVMETALGLPREFGALPIEDQVSRMKAGTMRRFGSDKVAELAQPDMLERVVQRYLALSQLATGQPRFSVALSLLQDGGRA